MFGIRRSGHVSMRLRAKSWGLFLNCMPRRVGSPKRLRMYIVFLYVWKPSIPTLCNFEGQGAHVRTGFPEARCSDMIVLYSTNKLINSTRRACCDIYDIRRCRVMSHVSLTLQLSRIARGLLLLIWFVLMLIIVVFLLDRLGVPLRPTGLRFGILLWSYLRGLALAAADW